MQQPRWERQLHKYAKKQEEREGGRGVVPRLDDPAKNRWGNSMLSKGSYFVHNVMPYSFWALLPFWEGLLVLLYCFVLCYGRFT